ncbi:MAG: TetR/AcrR family transcriptional regulator [Pseudomonadales bacterium]|jgi:AcrR family transcriptional regulator|nr:TetR/AcrR family transcriptional regulator [Pseudomonadales bacterium]
MTEIAPRALPEQARARATVERILEASARLLQRDGLDAFNTNAIAAEAEVRVSTVYRYFPNKHAILAEFARRFAAAEEAWLEDFGMLARGGDWRAALATLLKQYTRRADAFPAVVALRQATRALPELQAIERASTERLVTSLTRVLRARGRDLSSARARAVATAMLETASHLIDVSRTLPAGRRRALRAELPTLLEAHLATVLD